MMKYFRSIAVLSLAAVMGLSLVSKSAFSQQKKDISTFRALMHMKDSTELLLMHTVGKSFTPTPPPPAPIINVAEFNRMEGAIVAYDNGFGVPYTVLAEIAEDDILTTIVSGSSQENYVSSLYSANGVNLQNCYFLYAPVNSYWTRDYGPWFVIDGNDELGIVDFPYNRPRPSDDDIPVKVANDMGINLFGMNLIHTGGNYMTDGMGISASSDLLESENPALSTADIDTLVYDYLGIQDYHLLDDPQAAYIKHIDCWGKFLDVDKILLTEVPSSDPRYLDYEAIASYFSTQISSYGNYYEVHRVYSPNGQPYTNSLILNEKVLVPIMGGSAAAWNDTALNVYSQAMPGYEVIGFTQSSPSWQSTDALHCRAKGIAHREMIHIYHNPILGDQFILPNYQVRARIITLGGDSLLPDSVYLSYSVGGGSYQKITMLPDTGSWYNADIPSQLPLSIISYIIHASDTSGKSEMHPLIGYSDPHEFTITNVVGGESPLLPELEVKIFPNPADDITFINLRNLPDRRINITVSNLMGQLIARDVFDSNGSGFSQVKMNTSSWKDGIYLVNIVSGSVRKTLKLSVIH